MPDPIPSAYQEVLDHLAKRAEDPEHGDSFKLKVLRRPNAASQITQYVATFTDASLSMISNAESWLAPFAGGGLYVLHVYDSKGRRQHGVLTPSEITGSPRAPDPRVTKTSQWLGPTLIDAPVPSAGNGAIALSPLTMAGEPYPPVPPRSVQGEAGLAGLFDPGRRQFDEDLRKRAADLEDREKRLTEEKHRAEIERVTKAHEDRMRALEAKIDAQRAAPAVAVAPTPGPNLAEVITSLAGIITPALAGLFQMSAEEKRRRLELERAHLEAEQRRAEAAAAPKPLVDPQILDIINRQAERSEQTARQFGELMRAQAESSRLNLESQGVAQRSMLQTIAQVMEIQAKTDVPDAPGPDWGKIALGVMQGLAMMKGGAPPGAVPPGSQPSRGVAIPQPQIAAPPAPVPRSDAMTMVEKMVREKKPTEEVIAALKKAIEDPGAKREIEAQGGLMDVIEARLQDFAQDEKNSAYVEALTEAFQKSDIEF